MIFDFFPYFNERELLDLRYVVLKGKIDVFVLAEAGETHSGAPKPLHFHEMRDEFPQFTDKNFIYISIDKFPEGLDNWGREIYQRRLLNQVLPRVQEDDVVMISDLDEIPNPDFIDEAIRISDREMKPVALYQRTSYYYLNNVYQPAEGSFEEFEYGPRICCKKYSKNDLHWMRRANLFSEAKILRNDDVPTGWHLSYQGGVSRIQTKIAAFGHQEFNLDSIKDGPELQWKIETGRDILNRSYKYETIGVDHTFPRPVQENPEKYSGLLKSVYDVQSKRHRSAESVVSCSPSWQQTPIRERSWQIRAKFFLFFFGNKRADYPRRWSV